MEGGRERAAGEVWKLAGRGEDWSRRGGRSGWGLVRQAGIFDFLKELFLRSFS
jgi:hypothetical protein